MSKVVITYWNNSTTVSKLAGTCTGKAKQAKSRTPEWFLFTVVVLITFMLCLAINFRAIAEMNEEVEQHERLNINIENLSAENLALQEEIFRLQNDSGTIEREARKIGMIRPNEKILVPTN